MVWGRGKKKDMERRRRRRTKKKKKNPQKVYYVYKSVTLSESQIGRPVPSIITGEDSFPTVLGGVHWPIPQVVRSTGKGKKKCPPLEN